jgi:hypothetical protein
MIDLSLRDNIDDQNVNSYQDEPIQYSSSINFISSSFAGLFVDDSFSPLELFVSCDDCCESESESKAV